MNQIPDATLLILIKSLIDKSVERNPEPWMKFANSSEKDIILTDFSQLAFEYIKSELEIRNFKEITDEDLKCLIDEAIAFSFKKYLLKSISTETNLFVQKELNDQWREWFEKKEKYIQSCKQYRLKRNILN